MRLAHNLLIKPTKVILNYKLSLLVLCDTQVCLSVVCVPEHHGVSPAPVSSGTQRVWKCRPEWNLFGAETPGGSCGRTESNGGGSFLQQEACIITQRQNIHAHNQT